MFACATSIFSVDLSHFDSSPITTVQYMFNECRNVRFINLTNFNPPNVTNSAYTFRNCYALTSIDMTNCNIPCDSYTHTFDSTSSLISLDLSKWKPSNLYRIDYFMTGSKKLLLLDISNFDTTQVGIRRDEFTDCNKLKYINLRYYKGIDIFSTIPYINRMTYCIENIDNLPSSAS